MPTGTPEKALMVDGPVVTSILKSLESLQSEARENVRTMTEVRVEMGRIGEKVGQLASDSVMHHALAERTARLEADRESMRLRIDAMSSTLKWAVGMAVPAVIGVIGLIFTIITMVRK